jgi:ureidoacrylate peracid hydrolase
MVLRFLILAGCLTDQCVESAVRDACDKHYYVTLVTGDSILHTAQ